MIKIGHHASHEQFKLSELLRQVSILVYPPVILPPGAWIREKVVLPGPG